MRLTILLEHAPAKHRLFMPLQSLVIEGLEARYLPTIVAKEKMIECDAPRIGPEF